MSSSFFSVTKAADCHCFSMLGGTYVPELPKTQSSYPFLQLLALFILLSLRIMFFSWVVLGTSGLLYPTYCSLPCWKRVNAHTSGMRLQSSRHSASGRAHRRGCMSISVKNRGEFSSMVAGQLEKIYQYLSVKQKPKIWLLMFHFFFNYLWKVSFFCVHTKDTCFRPFIMNFAKLWHIGDDGW